MNARQEHGSYARDIMFVVGMGRSGTSALTRVLSLCGAALPLQMLSPNIGNPRGYWEPRLAMELNERFLHAHGSSWYDPSLRLQCRRVVGTEADRFVDAISALLVKAFESDGPIVVKDPRVSGLLPYWISAAKSVGLRVSFIHCFRNPRDVAASLRHLYGLDSTQSDALWLKYHLIAERDTRGFPRVFVAYEDLMASWEPVVVRCIDALSVPLSIVETTREAIGLFLSSDLHHHAAPDGRPSSARVLRTYELLNAAKAFWADPKAFDAVLSEHARVLDAHAGTPA